MLEQYNSGMTPSQIAAQLSAELGRRIDPNSISSIVSRYGKPRFRKTKLVRYDETMRGDACKVPDGAKRLHDTPKASGRKVVTEGGVTTESSCWGCDALEECRYKVVRLKEPSLCELQ